MTRRETEAAALRPRTALLWFALGTVVSALCVWWLVRTAELDETWDALTQARVGPLLAAVVVTMVVYVFQAARWRIVAGRPDLSLRSFLANVLAGVACNNVLPVRLGDVFRARWLALDGKMPSGRAFGTVVRDRIFDVAALVCLLIVSMPFVTNDRWARRIEVAGACLLLVAVGAIVLARGYARSRDRSRIVQRGRLRRIVRDMIDELAVPLPARRLLAAALLAAAAWGTWCVAAWLVADGIGIELTTMDVLFVAGIVNLGVAIPSSPGFVGTYEWLVVAALAAVGVGLEDALAFGILLHGVWFVPTTLIGGVFAVRRGVTFVARRAREPASADYSRAP